MASVIQRLTELEERMDSLTGDKTEDEKPVNIMDTGCFYRGKRLYIEGDETDVKRFKRSVDRYIEGGWGGLT